MGLARTDRAHHALRQWGGAGPVDDDVVATRFECLHRLIDRRRGGRSGVGDGGHGERGTKRVNGKTNGDIPFHTFQGRDENRPRYLLILNTKICTRYELSRWLR